MLAALHADQIQHPSADDLAAARWKYKPPQQSLKNVAPPPKLMGQPEYEP